MSGLCQAIVLRQGRHHRRHDLREIPRRRRNLARQHLSRVVLRRAVTLLPVHLCDEPGLDQVVLAGRRDTRVLPRADRSLPAEGRHPVRHRDRRGRFVGGSWHLTTDAGEEMSHDFLIAATGVLREPRTPSINGLTEFGGAVMHSARWNHRVGLSGKRVAVIGTGSTGVQIVCGLADSVNASRPVPAQRAMDSPAAQPPLPPLVRTDASPGADAGLTGVLRLPPRV